MLKKVGKKAGYGVCRTWVINVKTGNTEGLSGKVTGRRYTMLGYIIQQQKARWGVGQIQEGKGIQAGQRKGSAGRHGRSGAQKTGFKPVLQNNEGNNA